MSKEKAVSELAEQAFEITEVIGSLLGNDKYNLGAVMSALVNLLVDTALDQADMPPEKIISVVANAVCVKVELAREELQQEREEVKWLN
jgi:hypothetical protein